MEDNQRLGIIPLKCLFTQFWDRCHWQGKDGILLYVGLRWNSLVSGHEMVKYLWNNTNLLACSSPMLSLYSTKMCIFHWKDFSITFFSWQNVLFNIETNSNKNVPEILILLQTMQYKKKFWLELGFNTLLNEAETWIDLFFFLFINLCFLIDTCYINTF